MSSKNIFIISYFCPEHEIFRKDYERPKTNDTGFIDLHGNIKIPNDFFLGLPLSKCEKKHYHSQKKIIKKQ